MSASRWRGLVSGVGKILRKNGFVPRHAVVQLSKQFPQDWSLGLAENGVPKLPVMLKGELSVAGSGYSVSREPNCPVNQDA